MNRRDTHFSMEQTEEWLGHLRANNRKEGTIRTHRNNVYRCLLHLWGDLRSTDARDITVDDVHYLWRSLPVKEGVRVSYLRSLAGMVSYHTGVDVVKRAGLLRNREARDRVFITDGDLRAAYSVADPMQRLIICLGAYMGLRRAEMHAIRDSDIEGNVLTVHGKGHGPDGLVTRLAVPGPVMDAVTEYKAARPGALREDDYLIQSLGREGRLHRIHISRISDCITALGRAVGVRMTTHSLRRYYATTLYYSTGSDLQTVRSLMRHADVTTTLKCYVDAYDRNAMIASERLVEHVTVVVSGCEAEEEADRRGGGTGLQVTRA